MGAWVGPPGDYYELLDHPGERAERGDRGRRTGEMADERTGPQGGLTTGQAGDNKVKTGANREPTG
jgi:hypothetical protein